MKNNYYLIVILLVVVIGILACVLTQNVGTTETIGNTENTFATTNTNTNTNSNTQNVTNTTEENTNDIAENNNTTDDETQNVTENVEQPVTNNQIYESDSDIGTTDKKQEAINLVKDVWGEDNTVTYRFDNITSDGKYIIAVVSLKTASVKNYFKVDLNTKQVEVDY